MMPNHRVTKYRMALFGTALLVTAACQSSDVGDSEEAKGGWDAISEAGKITIGVSNEPPFSVVAPNGDVSGIGPDIIRTIMAEDGVTEIDASTTNFAGLIPGLTADRYDIASSGIAIRPERCLEVAFSEPTFALVQSLAVAAGNPYELHSVPDVVASDKVRLGVIQASLDEADAKAAGVPTDRLVSFPDTPALYDGLRNGRIDAALQLAVEQKIAVDKLAESQVEIVEQFEQMTDSDGLPMVQYVGDAFRKDDTELLARYNDTLTKIRDDGRLLAILEEYGLTETAVPDPAVTTKSLCEASD